MKTYVINYTARIDLTVVIARLKQRLVFDKPCGELLAFLNEQRTYYTIHFRLSDNGKFTMFFITVEEDYMNMFYLKTGIIYREAGDFAVHLECLSAQ